MLNRSIFEKSQRVFSNPDMKKYDLVLINTWQFEGEKLPILILVRTTGNLSRKEERSLTKNPRISSIEEAKQHLKNLQKQIDPIQVELDLIEAED